MRFGHFLSLSLTTRFDKICEGVSTGREVLRINTRVLSEVEDITCISVEVSVLKQYNTSQGN